MIIFGVVLVVVGIVAYRMGMQDGINIQKNNTTPCIFKAQKPAPKKNSSDFII